MSCATATAVVAVVASGVDSGVSTYTAVSTALVINTSEWRTCAHLQRSTIVYMHTEKRCTAYAAHVHAPLTLALIKSCIT
jgi:hypothetical protein